MFRPEALNIVDEPTKIVDGGDGSYCLVTNVSTDTDIYVGGADVTVENGTPIGANRGRLRVELGKSSDDLYGITAADAEAEIRKLVQ